MVPQFRSFVLVTVAALAASCSRELPMQPMHPDVIAQDTVPPDTLAPPNDNIANPAYAFPLPYDDTARITFATVEPGEPSSTCDGVAGPASRSVWYFTISNASGPMTAQLLGADTMGVLAVYAIHYDSTGQVLTEVGCTYFGGSVTFATDSGDAFYFQVHDFQGLGDNFVFHLEQQGGGGTGPANDNFANAAFVTGVPYYDNVDLTNATREAFEPSPYCGFANKTVWYSFTPSETRGVLTGFRYSPYFTIIGVYTGSSLNDLSLLRCGYGNQNTSFIAEAGTTYYVQVAADGGSGQFFLEPLPPPQAYFYNYPSDPSSFDVVQFYDGSYDPAGIGIQTEQWDFGDGATGTGYSPTHRYAADGDYLVQLTVTTYDGRTASTSRVLQVRTRDVAITRFATPSSGQTGKTTRITVDIRSNRYPETVQVQLFKSVPGGFQLVATSVQTLPVRNKTTSVSFSYTFTSQDASIGKVTFKAVVSLFSGRDALPADNEAIGAPTKVTR